MKKIIISILGILLCLGGILSLRSIFSQQQIAISRDSTKVAHGVVDGPPLCEWKINTLERVMSENASQALVLETTNPTDTTCESLITLSAPGFDSSPSNSEQKIVLPVKKTGSISWIVTPRKTGTYDVSVSDGLTTKILGITVNNAFGLSAMHVKLLSGLGTLFGPMFTVPWWWEKLRQRKVKNNSPQAQA